MLKRDELTNPASCMSRAHDDEMTFVLLGRDVAAPAAIRAWVRARIAAGKNKLDDPQIQEALNCIGAMQDGHTDVELDSVHKAADIMHECLDIIKNALAAWYKEPLGKHLHQAYGAAIQGLRADVARCRSFSFGPHLYADTTTDANKTFRTSMPITTMADVVAAVTAGYPIRVQAINPSIFQNERQGDWLNAMVAPPPPDGYPDLPKHETHWPSKEELDAKWPGWDTWMPGEASDVLPPGYPANVSLWDTKALAEGIAKIKNPGAIVRHDATPGQGHQIAVQLPTAMDLPEQGHARTVPEQNVMDATARFKAWQHQHSCQHCGATPDETGERAHGRGCYTIDAGGGGSDYIELDQPFWIGQAVVDSLLTQTQAFDASKTPHAADFPSISLDTSTEE